MARAEVREPWHQPVVGEGDRGQQRHVRRRAAAHPLHHIEHAGTLLLRSRPAVRRTASAQPRRETQYQAAQMGRLSTTAQ